MPGRRSHSNKRKRTTINSDTSKQVKEKRSRQSEDQVHKNTNATPTTLKQCKNMFDTRVPQHNRDVLQVYQANCGQA